MSYKSKNYLPTDDYLLACFVQPGRPLKEGEEKKNGVEITLIREVKGGRGAERRTSVFKRVKVNR